MATQYVSDTRWKLIESEERKKNEWNKKTSRFFVCSFNNDAVDV